LAADAQRTSETRPEPPPRGVRVRELLHRLGVPQTTFDEWSLCPIASAHLATRVTDLLDVERQAIAHDLAGSNDTRYEWLLRLLRGMAR
jgi:hypothetical protein